MNDETLRIGRRPPRPENGWLAWLATVGYISKEHSPDAMLTVKVYPLEDQYGWSASVTWAQHVEEVHDFHSFAGALTALWAIVGDHYQIFLRPEDGFLQPKGYSDERWLDADTASILERLTDVVNTAFGDDWMLIIVYQPLAEPDLRVQMRLVARGDSVHVSGRGPALRDACGALYRNAAPKYFSK
ncbi:MAG: hypothetical protein D6737_07435 [Chloroflexi bacterium]|nr:MAG: hypothetical protein D6737_07435 [Chloroflexota bacterium]